MSEKILARYSSIGFRGTKGEHTFVNLATPKGEIRAYLTNNTQRRILSSLNIGKMFMVRLGPVLRVGMVDETNLLDVTPA